MTLSKRYIFIGASAASMGALHKLRQLDPSAEILIFSAEKELPYNKCFLADFLAGIADSSRLQIYRPVPQVTLHLDTRIIVIDPQAKTVTTHAGASYLYDALFLGMGSGPWIPPIPGSDTSGVFTFHTMADTLAIQEHIKKFACKKAVVCGAGLSGLEAADALKAQGLAVTVIEKNSRVLPNLLDQEAADFLHAHMRNMGVNLVLNQSVSKIESVRGKITGVYLSDGSYTPADILIIATGLRANTLLGDSAGIAYGPYGVIVDEYMRTNKPDIFAGGDLIQVTDTLTGRPLRSCMWPDAMQQGMHAALAMAGQPKPYHGAAIIVSSAFFGLKFAQAGPEGSQERIAQGADFYHKISQNQGILQGFRVLGKRHDLGLLRRLLLTRQPILDSLDPLF